MPFPISGPRGPRKANLLQPSPPELKCVPVPAPMGGINAVDGLFGMGERSPQDAIFLYNLIPSQYGTKVRTGYRDWATDVGDDGVRTILPYTGSTAPENRLWAMAADGIYDVSTGGASPVVDTTFPVADTNSGYGQWTNYTTIAGHFALYTDETNGYYTYTESTQTWAKIVMGAGATEVANVDPDDFVHVTIYKERAWFVERDSARAWYLPTGAIYGAATVFNFGNKFKHGGTLVGLYNWTVDGGEGTNDYLVAISSSGDIILYNGSDPSVATDFSQQGQWYIGPPPAGRRIAGSFGGELYVLSAYGIVPLTRLISGALIQQDDVYLSRKITPLINSQMDSVREELGWEIKLISTENLLVCSVPKRVGFSYLQFVQALNSKGWAVYRDVPYFTGDTWDGLFYMGTSDGRVLVHSGTQDAVDLDGESGVAIEWSAMSVFQEYGEVGRYKITQFIRPVFEAAQAPSYSVEARYDYNLSEVLPSTASPIFSGSVWDSGVWDLSLWGGDLVEIEKPVGGSGIGRNIAVAINGSSSSPTILIRYDLMFTSGGVL
jgi:hypothetical protein